MSSKDPSFEGFVIRDRNGNRWKCKTTTYCALHHMKDNGNIILPERLVEIVLKGEKDEVKAIMPEVSSALDEVSKTVEETWQGLTTLWEASKHIESQKDFAMAVKNHPFNGLLFAARKTNKPLEKLWRADPEKVAEKLFAKKTFWFDVIEETEKV